MTDTNDAIFAVLREKWVEVPGGSDQGERVFSSDLMTWPIEQLIEYWDAQFKSGSDIELRGWYQVLYRDLFRGKRVLVIGSGLGFDGVYFLLNGADWTFADIVPSNLLVIERVATLKCPDAPRAFLTIETMGSFGQLPFDFDYVWCNGSLINAPFAHAREESHQILTHLRPGERWIELAYPPERWVREGSPPLSEWGKMTDGARTPWCEWYDLEKLRKRLFPARMLPILNMKFSSENFIWFDLLFDSDKRYVTHADVNDPIFSEWQVPLAGFRSFNQAPVWPLADGVRIETPAGIWHYAAAVPVSDLIAAMNVQSLPGAAVTVDIVCAVELGAVGISFMDESCGTLLSREVAVAAQPGPVRITVTTRQPLVAAHLMVRNYSGLGASTVRIDSLTLRLST
jgi:SAM-dependent methyltransferase